MLRGAFQCACGITVEEVHGRRYALLTGHLHICQQEREAWMHVLVSDALAGSNEAARLLPMAVDAWLRGSE